ncbi:MAG: biotin--[acetyl-CoA-carboxylase] ligase [Bacteroidales bacterium]
MDINMITYTVLDSTNGEAARLRASGSVRGEFFVSAHFQQDGRGQAGRKWVSDPGKNLLMSWVVFPVFLSVNQQFQLSKAVSLAITDLLEGHSIPCRIKWPNDIISNSGKIAGILIENSWQGREIRQSIVGIGLNINQKIFPVFPYPAVGMIGENGKEYNTDAICEEMVERLEKRYEQLRKGAMKKINSDYHALLFRLNEESLFSTGDSEFTGRIEGVSETGELIVERGNRLYNFGFHELKMHY